MAASYPSAVKSFSTKVDGAGNTISASHINDPQAEITAIEGGLLNGVAHALKPSSDQGQDLGTAGLRWHHARVDGIQLADATTVTLASDIVTVTHSYHAIDTEGAAASDNCVTITAGAGVLAGFLLVLRAADVTHVVTLKDGSGNLLLNGDCALSATDATISLIYDGTNWRETARSKNVIGFTPYVPTLVSVTTSGETDVISFTVPAAAMADGDVLLIDFAVQLRNSTGGAITPVIKFKWGASSVTLTSGSWSSIAATRNHLIHLRVQRVGNDLWVLDPPAATATGIVSLNFDLVSASAAPTAQVMSTPTFSSGQTVKLTVTLAAYNATNNFWNTLAARISRLSSS